MAYRNLTNGLLASYRSGCVFRTVAKAHAPWAFLALLGELLRDSLARGAGAVAWKLA